MERARLAVWIVATHVPQGGRGDRFHVEMRRLGDTQPQELQELLKSDPKAEKAWKGQSAGERATFVLFVAAAKKPQTRMRRARRLLGR